MSSRLVKFTTAASTNLTKLSDGPMVFRGGVFVNTLATVYYIKLYFYVPTPAAPTPTVGTTIPDMTIAVPPLDAAGGAGQSLPYFDEGVAGGSQGNLWVAVTNLSPDTDATVVGAGQGVLSFLLG